MRGFGEKVLGHIAKERLVEEVPARVSKEGEVLVPAVFCDVVLLGKAGL